MSLASFIKSSGLADLKDLRTIDWNLVLAELSLRPWFLLPRVSSGFLSWTFFKSPSLILLWMPEELRFTLELVD